MPVAYAVVACSSCKNPWSIELRHARVTCPRCQTSVDVKRRRRLWEGLHAADARVAAGRIAAAMANGRDIAEAGAVDDALTRSITDARPVPKHDSPIDAAAAQARGIVNKGKRAEEVALWLTRLVGDTPHEVLAAGLRRAGLEVERAEKEIDRMLAADVTFEPKVGHYRHLDP